MTGAKITLSAAEIELFGNAALLLTKNHILVQTTALLEGLQQQMVQSAARNWPQASWLAIPPKISRGENYGGLPYRVLDYPRIFSPDGVFAVRSFFWWGHFYSSTLQLSGKYMQPYAQQLEAAGPALAAAGYWLQTTGDPWNHHVAAPVYIPMPATGGSLAPESAFIKIAAKWPLEEWPFAANRLLESWERLLRICLH